MTSAGPGLRLAAVDLGASSGRVMVARVGSGSLSLSEEHRFGNAAVTVGGSLLWDVLGIYREVQAGLRAASRTGPIDGVGVDSWAVDYGLLDRDGVLLGHPHSHRDARTDGVAERVHARVAAEELYRVNGLQELPFHTIYQLAAARGTAALEAAETLLLIPDLLGYWLTGRVGAEHTNASTTGLYDVAARAWSRRLCEAVDVSPSLLPPLVEPGEVIGPVRDEAARAAGLAPGVPVIAVGSHDTASAVVGVPMADVAASAYISSGTWSLVGLELPAPVLDESARRAGFTNEGGVDGTTRFLKNVMGLWVLSECVRAWSQQGLTGIDLPTMLAGASEVAPLRTVVDIDDPTLLAPGTSADPMPDRVVALARRCGAAVPEHRVALVRCVLDSLALAYRRHLRAAGEVAGRTPQVVHVVGGGSRNALLCQLTADATGLPVVAGPAEAAALGNALVQARALGADLPDLGAMRHLLRETQPLQRYEPRSGLDWEAAERRLAGTAALA